MKLITLLQCMPLLLLLAGCHYVSVEKLNTPIPKSTATDPVPRTDEYGMRRTSETLQRVQQEGLAADLIFLGDSITEMWEEAGKPVCDRLFAEWKTLNLGVGGDQTQHVLWRLE